VSAKSDSKETGLRYPIIEEPETGDGSAVEVAPGVLWLRMPLFSSLPWINVWALASEEGWTLVDTGLRSSKTVDAWQSAFAGALDGAAVARVLVTHMHPDHCGMAGWMTEQLSVRLWMTRLEYLTARLMSSDMRGHVPIEGVEFYRAAGWDQENIEGYKAKFGSFGEMIHPLPASYRRITDGETFLVGNQEWSVVVGNGHSPEHACLYCPQLKLLISGDQVLPRISSNVSVFPTEPDANPLQDWLTSLGALKARIPEDVLVLPAHNSPFNGLHTRLDQLIDGHLRNLARLEETLAERRRVVDVFGSLFARPITSGVLSMATGEAVAHLNYLRNAGRVVREIDQHGVWWWRRPRSE
jgi:glyoxylase-like metal-dependent hydrolase (beta-lactamase superfamily II)